MARAVPAAALAHSPDLRPQPVPALEPALAPALAQQPVSSPAFAPLIVAASLSGSKAWPLVP
jgi:hypothetical protein